MSVNGRLWRGDVRGDKRACRAALRIRGANMGWNKRKRGDILTWGDEKKAHKLDVKGIIEHINDLVVDDTIVEDSLRRSMHMPCIGTWDAGDEYLYTIKPCGYCGSRLCGSDCIDWFDDFDDNKYLEPEHDLWGVHGDGCPNCGQDLCACHVYYDSMED